METDIRTDWDSGLAQYICTGDDGSVKCCGFGLFNRWTSCGEVVNTKTAPKSTSHLICSHAVSFFPRAGSSAWQDLCVHGVVVQFLSAADSVARINVGIAIIWFAILGNLVPSSIRFQKKLKIWDRIWITFHTSSCCLASCDPSCLAASDATLHEFLVTYVGVLSDAAIAFEARLGKRSIDPF